MDSQRAGVETTLVRVSCYHMSGEEPLPMLTKGPSTLEHSLDVNFAVCLPSEELYAHVAGETSLPSAIANIIPDKFSN